MNTIWILARRSCMVALALLIAACASRPPSPLETHASVSVPVVARVNGEALKYAEFKQELDSITERIHQAGQIIDGTMYAQLQREVLESLIHLILMDQYSGRLGIEVNDAQVKRTFDAAVSKYPSRDAFHAALSTAGLTEQDIRLRLKRSLAAQEVVKTQVEPQVTVSDAEVRSYYDAHPYEFEHGILVHAAHILIKVNPLADKETKLEAKQRLKAIQNRIQRGEDFASLARQFSEGPSKGQGGDIGYFGSAQMAPAFETAAFSLQPGDVSDIVATQVGYHLIKVYDRKPAGREPFSEAGPQLKARITSERINDKLRLLVDKLKTTADIERFALDPPES